MAQAEVFGQRKAAHSEQRGQNSSRGTASELLGQRSDRTERNNDRDGIEKEYVAGFVTRRIACASGQKQKCEDREQCALGRWLRCVALQYARHGNRKKYQQPET